MKQLTLKIENSKYHFFLELLKNLDFVQIETIEEDSKEEIFKNIKEGVKDLKKYKEGKLETTLAKDFINEL